MMRRQTASEGHWMLRGACALLAFWLAAAAFARSAHADDAGPYAPYAFLIGDWDSALRGGPPAFVTRFSWGTGKSYIRYSVSLLRGKKPEPHLEGLLVWNGVNKNLDMLLAVDLRGRRMQERGTLSIGPDGALLRDVYATYSEGAILPTGERAGPAGVTLRFRQPFKGLADGRVWTAMLRETPSGWVATLPGSDDVIMTLRPAG